MIGTKRTQIQVALKIIIPDGGAKTCPIYGGKGEE